jgi:hypothetical protein
MPGKNSFLLRAVEDKLLIRFSRPFERGSVNGYVLDVGPKFMLMAVFGDGFTLNGFLCCRIADIRRLKYASDSITSMHQTVLRKRGQEIPPRPPIDLTTVESILQSANQAFPLVAIHREKIKPGACHIGCVTKISEGKFWMREIDTDASWGEDELFRYKLSDVTLVEFNGDYERGLYEAGGPPPLK